jgi:hypothetical protein
MDRRDKKDFKDGYYSRLVPPFLSLVSLKSLLSFGSVSRLSYASFAS